MWVLAQRLAVGSRWRWQLRCLCSFSRLLRWSSKSLPCWAFFNIDFGAMGSVGALPGETDRSLGKAWPAAAAPLCLAKVPSGVSRFENVWVENVLDDGKGEGKDESSLCRSFSVFISPLSGKTVVAGG